MKSIKMLFVAFLLIFSIMQIKAQEKPTKEDAIKWIIKKMTDYGSFEYHKRDGNDIYFYIKNSSLSYTIDFDLLTGWDYGPSYDIKIYGKNGMVYECHAKNFERCTDYMVFNISYYMTWDAEENLQSRFVKALNTIIEHNKKVSSSEKF